MADTKRLPDVVVVIDMKKEALAVREARRLNIPVVGLVDTNCDPDVRQRDLDRLHRAPAAGAQCGRTSSTGSTAC